MSDLIETKSKVIKLIEEVIERVGFPICAFLLICAICFYSMEKLASAVNSNTSALMTFSLKQTEFQQVVIKDHTTMMMLLSSCMTKKDFN